MILLSICVDMLFPVPKMISNFGSNLWGNMFSSDKKTPNRRQSVQVTDAPNKDDGRLISSSAFNKISETLGALNTVGRLIVNMTRGQSVSITNSNVQPSDSVPDAILTLTKNVLGQNVTKKIEPFIKRVDETASQTQQKPNYSIANYENSEETTTKKAKRKKPKKQKVEVNQSKVDTISSENTVFDPSSSFLNETYNAPTNPETDIQGKEGEHRCTTPAGKQGRCEDLSNCPGLLLDLTHLRESLCFKSLFVPGVCCPLDELSEDTFTQRPIKLTTAPTRSTTRQTLILRPTSRRPLVPVQTISSESQSPSHSASLSAFDNFVDPEDCGQQEVNSGRIVGGKKALSGEWPCKCYFYSQGRLSII